MSGDMAGLFPYRFIGDVSHACGNLHAGRVILREARKCVLVYIIDDKLIGGRKPSFEILSHGVAWFSQYKAWCGHSKATYPCVRVR